MFFFSCLADKIDPKLFACANAVTNFFMLRMRFEFLNTYVLLVSWDRFHLFTDFISILFFYSIFSRNSFRLLEIFRLFNGLVRIMFCFCCYFHSAHQMASSRSNIMQMEILLQIGFHIGTIVFDCWTIFLFSIIFFQKKINFSVVCYVTTSSQYNV